MIRIFAFSMIAALATFINCGGGGGSSGSGSSDQYPRYSDEIGQMMSFSFAPDKNPALGLKADITGVIADNKITLTVPSGSATTSLTANFVTNNADVQVNGISQTSGVTVNDFSNPVIYTVNPKGNKKDYTVTVIKAPSTEKTIKIYSINGTSGKIDETNGTITVTLPPRSSTTSLSASFSAIGASIKVNGIDQITDLTKNNFDAPVEYIVTAEDSSSKKYVVTVIVELASWNEISNFSFYKKDNPSLGSDITGAISGNDIKFIVPYGTPLSDLVAAFVTEGASVKIADAVQTSSQTHNDFSTPKVYTVTAENGTTRDYTVAVEAAKNDAKAITRFALDGTEGTIDETAGTIAITLASNKSLSPVTASFVTTGSAVSVNGVAQVSGITANDFTSPVPYLVTADDGSSKMYTAQAIRSPEVIGEWNFSNLTITDGITNIVGATLVSGINGMALLFDKRNNFSFVEIASTDALALAESGTIETYINATTHRPFAGLVHKGTKTDFSDESYSLQFWGENGNDGTLRISIFNANKDYVYTESIQKLDLDKWYHIVATWDQSTLSLYINGKLESFTANTVGKVKTTTSPVIIGAQLNKNFSRDWGNLGFNGIIDGVRIYNRAITENDVKTNYNEFESRKSAIAAYLVWVSSHKTGVLFWIFIIALAALVSVYTYNRRKSRNSA